MNIAHLTYANFGRRESIPSLSERGEISKSESLVYEKIMGLRYVYRDADATYYDQFCLVFEKLISEYLFERKNIKYVFFAHTADDIAPEGVSILHRFISRYSLNKAQCFGSSSHKCATVFQFCRLSKLLFNSLSEEDFILLLIADLSFTKVLQVIPGSTVMGDIPSAVLLKKSGDSHKVIDILLTEDGRFSRGVFGDKTEQLLFQEIYVEKLSLLILSIIKKNNLKKETIKIIFPHNVNVLSWKRVAENLKIPTTNIYLDNILKLGHCFGSDPFINLSDAIKEKKIESGDYSLLVTVGLGATFAVMLLQH